MNYFKLALRSLFRKGQSNIIKIVCLAVGLSLGMILIAKVCFQNAYNSYIPDKDRVYIIRESFRKIGEGEFSTYPQTPGAIAPAFGAHVPQVEAGTRITHINNDDGKIVTSDNQKVIKAHAVCADSAFFDVFDIPVLLGNPKEILNNRGHAMISRSLAKKLGGLDNVLGQEFAFDEERDTKFIVDGVYEDLPENSSLAFDVMCSINNLPNASLENWMGNDRYNSFLKFKEGATAEEVLAAFQPTFDQHVDPEEIRSWGLEAKFDLISLDDFVNEDQQTKNRKNLMLFLGIALIVISMLNYLLIVISTLVTRVKEIAVNKCYGASGKDILSMTFCECFVHMTLALALGAVLIFAIRDKAEELLAASLSSLFAPQTLVLLGVIALSLVLVTALISAYIFANIPIAAAFRNLKESKRVWKLALLSVQFASTAGIVALLLTIVRQYDFMEKTDRGYDYENVLCVHLTGCSYERVQSIMTDLGRFPEVEKAAASSNYPIFCSGNNVFLPNRDYEEIFNVADMYFAGEGYFDAMGIKIVDGKYFPQGENNDRKILVSRSFVEKMENIGEWKDGAIGKEICISEHSSDSTDPFTVVGVFEDIRTSVERLRPQVYFCDSPRNQLYPAGNVVLKMHDMSPATLAKIDNFLANNVQEKYVQSTPLKIYIWNQLTAERNTRDAMIICSIVALVIALLGLFGYTTDEVNRRRKEIAIRKVLGASPSSLLVNVSKDISIIAIPSLFVGAAAAFYFATQWLQDYSEHIQLSFMVFAFVAAAIYLVIVACIYFRSLHALNENPVDALTAN